jgi:drug/metabolite transporter (DMT)-like permease
MANYFVAGSLGFILSGKHPFHPETLDQAWLPYGVVLSFMFISLFYLIALTTQKMGVSVASVSNKMSVVVPVLFALSLYDEKLGAVQWIGLLGAMAAVVMVSIKKSEENHEAKSKGNWLLPVVLFIGCGLLDTLINYLQFRFVSADLPASFLLSAGFLGAGIIGVLVFSRNVMQGKESIHPKSIIAGLILGVPNFFSMYLVMKTLESGIMAASVFFPVNNMGVVSAATLVSVLAFRERLSKLNIAGIFLSLLSIYLIAFG